MSDKEPQAARGTSPEAEPERPEPTETDADLIDAGEEAAEDAAKARELPDDQKAVQMTPEEYDAIGKGEPAETPKAKAPEAKAKEPVKESKATY